MAVISYLCYYLALIPLTSSWNVAYVANKLAIPVGRVTQEVLYCPCLQCHDSDVNLLMKSMQSATLHPQLVISQSDDAHGLVGHDVKRNLLTMLIIDSLDDKVVAEHRHLLQGRHFAINLVIMRKPQEDFTQVQLVLEYLFRNNFVNSDVYFQNASTYQDEVFGFASYPEFQMENKTHLVGKPRQFYHRMLQRTNLCGQLFQTPLMMDPPRVIPYREDELEKAHGIAFNIIQILLEYLNGSLHYSPINKDLQAFVDMRQVLQQVRDQRVDLAANAYALFHDDEMLQKSYPLLVVNWCLMVPIFKNVLTMLYPFTPFDVIVWLTCLISFVVVNVITYLFHLRHAGNGHYFILINFCKFLNLPPPPNREEATRRWQDLVLSGFVFIQGFFLAVMYTSTLGSYLTVTLLRDNINSMSDLLRVRLPVMIIDYELDFLQRQSIYLPSAFVKLLKPVDSSTFYSHQLDMNTSYAYFTTYDTWHFLNMLQQNLRPPLFHFSKICFGDYHLAFPMASESPIWRDVEHVMLRIHSSGLYYYHEKKSVEYAVYAGLVRRRVRSSNLQMVGLVHLRMVLGFVAVGSALALLSFLHELGYFRWATEDLRKWAIKKAVKHLAVLRELRIRNINIFKRK